MPSPDSTNIIVRPPFMPELMKGLADLVYPPTCICCHAPITEPTDLSLCRTCIVELSSDHANTCPRCAGTVGPFAQLETGCPRCEHERFHFDGAIRLGRYDGKLRDVILRMKQQNGEPLAETLGQLWAVERAAVFAPLNLDAVVPIPLHWLRWLHRGYNQTGAVARCLARGLKKPCRTHWLWRRKHTPPQAQQTPTDRRRHMSGTFHARPRRGLQGATILLVDDILTTGSTCNDAARALKSAGAGRVFAAILGRAEQT
jgi:ComF family protein